MILSEIGLVGEARRALKHAADLSPRRAGVQIAYAWSRIHISSRNFPAKPQEALIYSLRAVRENREMASAYEIAGDCYSMLGDQKRADAPYREFVHHGDPKSKLVQTIRADWVRRSALNP